jgi:hypothetical protein
VSLEPRQALGRVDHARALDALLRDLRAAEGSPAAAIASARTSISSG